MINAAPQPSEIERELKGSQIIMAGITIQSPAAFWVYSSVKIITVPAVTDHKGNLVCTTSSQGRSSLTSTSTKNLANATTTHSKAILFRPTSIPTSAYNIFNISGVNSNAEAYFGGYSISDGNFNHEPVLFSVTGYSTKSEVIETHQKKTVTYKVATETLGITAAVWTRSNGEIFTYSPPTTGNTVTFPTPYIYLPPRGADGGTGTGLTARCEQDNKNENYGYVPQSVVDYMVSEPEISRQYPGLASCLPGGPSILHVLTCHPFRIPSRPTIQQKGGDLTSTTVIIVTVGVGGFQTPLSTTGSVSRLTESHETHATLPPGVGFLSHGLGLVPTTTSESASTTDSLPALETVATSTEIQPVGAVSASEINPIITTKGEELPIPGTITVIKSSTFAVIGPTTIPINPNLPLWGSTTVIDNTPFIIIASKTIVPVPINTRSSSGALEFVSGSSILVVGPTTMPINPAFSIAGQTTTIDGTPVVIVTASTSILLPAPTTQPPLPGVTTILPGGATAVVLPAGATVPINPNFSLTGQTTIISGTTAVILASSTSVVLPPQNQGILYPPLPILPGSTTILPNGNTAVILSAGATVPVNSIFPASGHTTIISGTTEIILNSPTTFLLPLPIQTSLPPIVISGTTEILPGGFTAVLISSSGTVPVNSAYTVNGRTTVISGVTEVVVSASQTVILAPPSATGTGKSKKSIGRRVDVGWHDIVMILVGLGFSFVSLL